VLARDVAVVEFSMHQIAHFVLPAAMHSRSPVRVTTSRAMLTAGTAGCPLLADRPRDVTGIRRRSARLAQEHHQPLCPDNAPCSRFWYGRAATALRVDCQCGGRSAWPWSAAMSACRTGGGRDRCLESNHRHDMGNKIAAQFYKNSYSGNGRPCAGIRSGRDLFRAGGPHHKSGLKYPETVELSTATGIENGD
jgi:hypothetical protein